VSCLTVKPVRGVSQSAWANLGLQARGTMSETLADAIARLEAALDRIAAATESGGAAAIPPGMGGMAERVDGLIARIRAALGPESAGNDETGPAPDLIDE
jgi:hypothetical protein